MKYNITENGIKDDVLEFCKVEMLESIANELAEANKLKRIELELLIGTQGHDWLTDEGASMYRNELYEELGS